jgi:predicted TIM-barrel fold metal-dependent hydrolase
METKPIAGTDLRISADSHVAEPLDLWATRFPPALRDRAPRFDKLPESSHTRPGGWDPAERLRDLAVDYIAGEVLYPSLGNLIFREKDPEMAQALATVYNDWLIEYCRYAPDRLWGIACIPLWNIDFAVMEMIRCRKDGLVGTAIWLAPPDELPFYAPHYERVWATAQDLEMPICLHINAGFGAYKRLPKSASIEGVALRVHGNSTMAKDAVIQIILSGVLERYPRLKIVIGEVNWGWVPFWLQELDENYQRYAYRANENLAKLSMLPSEYYQHQCYATFMDDTIGGYIGGRWWHRTAMWSNDYPHWNGIWPMGTEILNRTLEPLTPEQRYDMVCGNVAGLYKKPVPRPLPRGDFEPSRAEMPARVQREHRRNL